MLAFVGLAATFVGAFFTSTSLVSLPAFITAVLGVTTITLSPFICGILITAGIAISLIGVAGLIYKGVHSNKAKQDTNQVIPPKIPPTMPSDAATLQRERNGQAMTPLRTPAPVPQGTTAYPNGSFQ